MKDAPAHSVSAWRITAVAAMSVLLLWLSVFCFVQLTQLRIDTVSIDASSEWGRYFFSETGFATIHISSHVASRRYDDYIATVGSNRPQAWFEEMGFEWVDDTEGHVHTITDTLPDEDSPRRVVVMIHPEFPKRIFRYLPDEGILIH